MSHRPKHHWTVESTRILLQVAVDEYSKCGNNKKGVHKAIAENFNQIVEETNRQRQRDFLEPVEDGKVRHKLDSLKREWVKWESLNNKTGAGWDSVRQTVSGSDEWWSDRVKEFGQIILKFKRGPIENLDLQQQLFQGTHATGSASYTPAFTQEQPPQSPVPQFNPFFASPMFNNPWCFEGVQTQTEDTEEQGAQNIPNLNSPTNPCFTEELPQQTPVQTPVQNRRNVGSSSSARTSSRKRRTDEIHEKLIKIVDVIHERQSKSSRTTSDSPNTNSVHSTGNSLSYPDMIARVKRLTEGADFNFGEALYVVTQPNNTDLFNALSDEDAKGWLEYTTNVERVSTSYKAFLINQGGGSK